MKLTKQGYFAKILNLLSTENSAVKSSVFYYQDLVEMQLSPLHKNQEEFCFFIRVIFNYQIIEYRQIQQKTLMQHCGSIFCCQSYFAQYIQNIQAFFSFFRKEGGLKLQNYNILSFCIRGIFRTFQTSEMKLFAERC